MCLLGTFSQRAVLSEASVVKIEDDIPLELAALMSCGVPTGFGSAVKAGEVKPGRHHDRVRRRRRRASTRCRARRSPARGTSSRSTRWSSSATSALKFGATHAVATAEEAQALALELTWGVGADQAIVTMGVVTEDVVSAAFAAIRKRGIVVLTGLAGPAQKTVNVSGFELALFEKRLQGALFGSSNPFDDIPRMLDLYRAGKLKLAELITTRYTLDQVNQGYEDMMAGPQHPRRHHPRLARSVLRCHAEPAAVRDVHYS